METRVGSGVLDKAREFGLLRSLEGKRFVFTGKMSVTRSALEALTLASAGKVQSVVGSSTDFLVIPEGGEASVSGNSKVAAAHMYVTRIINEHEFVSMILPSPSELLGGVWAVPATGW